MEHPRRLFQLQRIHPLLPSQVHVPVLVHRHDTDAIRGYNYLPNGLATVGQPHRIHPNVEEPPLESQPALLRRLPWMHGHFHHLVEDRPARAHFPLKPQPSHQTRVELLAAPLPQKLRLPLAPLNPHPPPNHACSSPTAAAREVGAVPSGCCCAISLLLTVQRVTIMEHLRRLFQLQRIHPLLPNQVHVPVLVHRHDTDAIRGYNYFSDGITPARQSHRIHPNVEEPPLESQPALLSGLPWMHRHFHHLVEDRPARAHSPLKPQPPRQTRVELLAAPLPQKLRLPLAPLNPHPRTFLHG